MTVATFKRLNKAKNLNPIEFTKRSETEQEQGVDLCNTKISDAELKYLKKLPQLNHFDRVQTQITSDATDRNVSNSESLD